MPFSSEIWHCMGRLCKCNAQCKIWLPHAAKTNLWAKPVSLFSHVLVNEGASTMGEVGLLWLGVSYPLVTGNWGGTQTQHCVWYRIIPSHLITPRLLCSAPETLHRYRGMLPAYPPHKERTGLEQRLAWGCSTCTVAAQCVSDEFRVKRKKKSQLLANF